MKRSKAFAIFVVTIVAAGVALSSALALAEKGHTMGPGMGMGPDMMGPDSDQGGAMMGGMMGRGTGGMMGMMGGCPMMGMMMGGGEMPMHQEGRIAFLKAELAVTDAQGKVWDAYAEALKKNMQGMQGMRETMMAARQGKTPVARLDAHVTAMEGRLQALKDLKPALASLYDALSDDQKKKADELLTGMGCMM
jgi:hypothetical protein